MKKFIPKKETADYNKRIGQRIKLFREIRSLRQEDIAVPLGYKSSGAWSLIEAGERGLNKTKIKHAAKILGTQPEILTADNELTKDDLIALDKFLLIRKNPAHPKHAELEKIISNSNI